MTKQKQCKNLEISRFFFVVLLKKNCSLEKIARLPAAINCSLKHNNTVGSSVF